MSASVSLPRTAHACSKFLLSAQFFICIHPKYSGYVSDADINKLMKSVREELTPISI